MRAKRKLFLTAAFTALLGVGAFAGVSSAKESRPAEVQATSTFTTGQNLYLVPGVWSGDNAAFIAHFFGNNKTVTDVWMTYDSTGGDWYNGTYHVIVPDEFASVIFCRMDPNEGTPQEGQWWIFNHKVWNQTDTINASGWDKCSITGWNQNNHSQSTQTASAFNTWVLRHSTETDGTTWNHSEDISLNSYQNNDNGSQLYNTSVSLTAGMLFKVVNTSKNWWIGAGGFEVGGACNGVYIERSDSDTEANLKVLKTGVYEVYVKLNAKKIWMQLSSQEEANIYANEFLGVKLCDGEKKTFEIGVWNQVSGTDSLEYKFGQLTQGARNIFAGAQADKDSDDPVKQCAARYDRILGRYGYGKNPGDLHDFMGRTPTPWASGTIILINSISSTEGSIIAIIVISSVSLAAIGGYFLFKKKHQ